MIRRFISLSLVAALVLPVVSCTKTAATPKDPDAEQKEEETTSSPVMGEFVSYPTEVSELSGLCLASDGKSLWTISDDAKSEAGGLYTLAFDGTCTQKIAFAHDLEGVTMDPSTGDLYCCVEGEQAVYKVAAPDYNEFELVMEDIQNGATDPSGKGLEGITWYKDNTIIVANQQKPTVLSFISLDKKEVLNSIEVGFAYFLSDICYDSTDDVLWISDSKYENVYRVSMTGELLDTYSLKDMLSNRKDYGKAEGLAVDHANSCLWIGCDVSNELFKVSMTF